jgi:hypothetical protein
MPKKKVETKSEVETPVQGKSATVPDGALPPNDLPLDAHTYYVWKDGAFVKSFSNEPYKGEALKFAQLYADEIGGTVQI